MLRHKNLTKGTIEGKVKGTKFKIESRLEFSSEIIHDMRYGSCQELKRKVNIKVW